MNRKKLFKYILLCVPLVAAGVFLLHLRLQYADDSSFLQGVADSAVKTGDESFYEVYASPANERSGISVYPSMSDEVRGKIRSLKEKMFLKDNPYSRNPYAVRFATGRAGGFVDEKNSLFFPDGSQLSMKVKVEPASRLEFYFAGMLFDADGEKSKKLRVQVQYDGRREYLLEHDAAVYSTEKFYRSEKQASGDFPGIYANTGWEKFTIDLGRYAGKEVTLLFSAGSGNKGISFIGNPLLLKKRAAKKYNVVYIIFDAMPRKVLGQYNSKSALTPFISGLDDKFIVMDKMYSTGSLTRLFLTGFFTDSIPCGTHIGSSFNVIPDEEKRIFYNDQRYKTLPQVFRENDYLTLQVGNSGFSNPVLATAVDYGFDESIDFQANPHDTTGIAYYLMKSLDSCSDKPFFMYAHFNTTHKPRVTPAGYYIKGFVKRPWLWWRKNVSGSALYADKVFSILYSFMEKKGLLENTIIIISADHGTLTNIDHYNGNTLYDDFARIPMLIYLPPELRAKYNVTEARIGSFTSVVNIPPTIIDFLGFRPEPLFKGKSIVPLFSTGEQPLFTDDAIFTFDNFGYSLVYNGRWKYIHNQRREDKEYREMKWYFLGDGYEDAVEQLYDLDKDPLEMNNIAFSRQDIINKCREKILATQLYPEIDVISLFPGKEKQQFSIDINSAAGFVRSGITGGDKSARIVADGGSLHVVCSVQDKPVYVYFETAVMRSPLSISIKVDGKPLSPGAIFAGADNLHLFYNPVALNNQADYLSVIMLRKPASIPGINGIPAVHYGRIDSRHWIRSESLDFEKNLDADMRDILKNWGYIQ